MVYDSVESFETAFENALNAAMNGSVADKAVEKVQEVINETVYQAYTPEFFDRSGALMEKANLPADYSGETLTITSTASWNNIGFFRTTGRGTYGELPEVIAHKGMYGAPPRDFLKASETALGSQSAGLEEELERELSSL